MYKTYLGNTFFILSIQTFGIPYKKESHMVLHTLSFKKIDPSLI